MIEIVSYPPNIMILDNNIFDEEDLNFINKEIRSLLIKREDLPANDKVTKRAFRHKDAIYIHAHGSFSDNIISSFIKKILTKNSINFKERDISEKEKQERKDMFPEYHFLGDQYFGGAKIDSSSTSRNEESEFSDSDTIDPYVDKLCEALNRVPGIETFASCNGHNGSRNFYILYTAENLHVAEIVVYYLTKLIDKLFHSLGLRRENIEARLEVAYMPFGVPTGIYFHFKIFYEKSVTNKVYKFSELAAEEINLQVSRGNFGTKNKETGYFDFEEI